MKILNCLSFYMCCSYVSGETAQLPNVSYIFGIFPIDCKGIRYQKGIPVLKSGTSKELKVFGQLLSSTSQVGFTSREVCDYVEPSKLTLEDGGAENGNNHKGIVTFTPPADQPRLSTVLYYICLKTETEETWRFQGTGRYVSLYVHSPLFTPTVLIAIIIICTLLSALMTGLNLGLMALDTHELQLIKNSGTPSERKYAAKIIPVRKNGNFLLCSIVITATLCNAISTVVTDEILSNFLTVVVTTIVIVFFCEILPQSICSAFPLYIGAHTIYLTKACMLLTSPISYPLSKLLTYLIGKELTTNYTKDKLKEIFKITRLPSQEEKIITGTLDFSHKRVEDVMTPLNDIFKLPITAVMNFETIAKILSSGYSRIPIYVGDKWNIQYVLLTKDLALLDPDDKVPVKTLVQQNKSTCTYILKGTTLDNVLGIFKSSRNHMLFVVDNEPRIRSILSQRGSITDTTNYVIGLVTFEDIIEEIFQMEIYDETDKITDNKSWTSTKPDLVSMLLQPTKVSELSQNLRLAAFHYLSGIEVFSSKYISPSVLISFMSMDVFFLTGGKTFSHETLYVRGVPVNYFIMILEGKMDIKIGKEELKFEVGPFRYFGIEALKESDPFSPEFTLQASQKSLYMKITKALYDAGLLATRYERFMETPDDNTSADVMKYYKIIVGIEYQRTASGSFRRPSHKTTIL